MATRMRTKQSGAGDQPKLVKIAKANLHPDIICDGCDCEINGVRFHCLDCDVSFKESKFCNFQF